MPHHRPNLGLPSRSQILDFIASATSEAGKREIARHFGLKGAEKIALKALLKDMAEEGLIDGKRTAYHAMGGVPKVTVLRVVAIDDGEAIAVPDNWAPETPAPPPRLTIIPPKRGKHGVQSRAPRETAALTVGDRVLARTEEVDGQYFAHPMKKLPAAPEALMGIVEIDHAGKAWLAPVDKRVRFSAPIGELGGAAAGLLVMAEPMNKSPRAPLRVTHVLGDPLAPRAFSLIAIHKYGLPHVFPPEALAEAEQAAKLPLDQTREDLTHLPITAIDPPDARDHDDAIWAAPDDDPANPGGFRAIVAIADVSYYVRPGGALDRAARERGNSVYFPDRVIPMLPEVLSADVCSLGEGRARAAMACHLTISAKGQVTSWRFARARVAVQVLAYEAAQAQIDADTAPEHLRQLWAAWALLAKARSAREPLELDLPERRVVLDDAGRIAEIALRERLDAHRLVEDFMIAANVAAAKALESRKAPITYRVHEPPTREKLVALKEYLASFDRKLALGQVITPTLFNRILADVNDEAELALIMEAVLRSQTQAYYGPRNAGHFGLALGSYAHFTSPIRRYADLLVHRALVDVFALELPAPGEPLRATSGLGKADAADLRPICDAISATERRAMAAERDTIDRYVAAWLAERVGEVFDCRVTGVQRFGLFATIIGLGGDGLVPVSVLGAERFFHDEGAQALEGEATGTRFAMGDVLRLRLAEANPLTGSLKFEPEEGVGGAVEPRGGPRPDGRKPRGAHHAGRRGRPANIRHQGRRR